MKESDEQLLKRLEKQFPDPKDVQIKGMRKTINGLRKENETLRRRIDKYRHELQSVNFEPTKKNQEMLDRVSKHLEGLV